MTTFAQVVERTRNPRLMSTQREPLNVLAANIDAVETSITLVHAVKFAEGSRLSIGIETMHVVSVSTLGMQVEVIRNVEGSTPVAHTAGDIVHVNPTWTGWDIIQAVNDDLADLSSPLNGLFRIEADTFTFIPVVMGYELSGTTGEIIDVWKVRYDTPGPETNWPVIPRRHWRFDQDADTGDFPSGNQLVIEQGGWPGHEVRVSLKTTFAQFDPVVDTLADDVLTVSGLHVEAHDILSVGAAVRLMSGLEPQRAYTNTQINERRFSDTPPQTAVAAITPLLRQREDRIKAEAVRLARRYPEAIF